MNSSERKRRVNLRKRSRKYTQYTHVDPRSIAGEYGSKPLYRNLGYFSLICLLRVHVLLGDPTRKSDQSTLTPVALQTMQHVELNSGAFMARITACHVTTYYHVSLFVAP